MELIRKFEVVEVKITNIVNAPIQITMDSNLAADKNSILVINKEISDRYKILITQDLIGRVIICTFSSRELGLEQRGAWQERVKTEELTEDDLLVRFLEKTETRMPYVIFVPPIIDLTVSRTLELSSVIQGEGINSKPQVPFYHFYLSLTESDYDLCKKLIFPFTVFKVSFSLKP